MMMYRHHEDPTGLMLETRSCDGLDVWMFEMRQIRGLEQENNTSIGIGTKVSSVILFDFFMSDQG